MSKKDSKKQNADSEELVSGASVSASGENDLPEGSEIKTGDEEQSGEEKGVDSPEIPPEAPKAEEQSSTMAAGIKDPDTLKEEKPEAKPDGRSLKVSVLASGKLFAAGLKASEIDPEIVESIPSKYFEGEK